MICKSCKKDLKHKAHGLCLRCYKANYRKTHKKEIKQYHGEYCRANRDKFRKYGTKYRRSHGGKPASENKQCSVFLGVHVAERVLSKVFKDVEEMPYGCKGYDFICNRGKKIDVKSSCIITHDKHRDHWVFGIKKNETADFFLCIAFDNREDLNPLHIWLIPGHIVNHLTLASIYKSTLSKWDAHKLNINKVKTCCDSIKSVKEDSYEGPLNNTKSTAILSKDGLKLTVGMG